MKKGRRLAGILIAVVLTLAMGMTTFAASITITPKKEQGTNHVYKVYQIFTGTEYTDDEDNPGLTDVKYGQNYHPGTSKEGDKVPETVLDEIKNAREEAQNEFIKNLYDEENPVATLSAGNNYKADGLTPGYYLIVDTIDGVMKEGDALSAYIVQVLHEEKIEPKAEFPELNKEITGEDGTEDENGTDEQKKTTKDELDIGDTVEFTLTGRVSENAADYKVYFWNAEDTLSKGLTLNAKGSSDFTVKVGGETLSAGTDYNVIITTVTNEKGENETHFSLALTPKDGDWSNWAGKTVTIEYSATLNENAVIGEGGNPNTEHLEYASDPEWDNGGKPGSLEEGRPAEGVDIPTGVTPDQTTYTYTTGIKILKVDEEGKVLLGAQFTITGNGMNIVLNEKKEFKEDPSGEYYKLKSKTGEPESYTKREPQLEDEMRPATDRNGGYVIDDEANPEDKSVVTVRGTKYRPATDAELKGTVNLFVLMKANADEYASPTQKYSPTITYEQVGETKAENVSAYVDAEGAVTFNGLGAGTYTITESETPKGFNTIDPFDVTITWSPDNTDPAKCTWTAECKDSKQIVNDDGDGTFSFTIQNRHGNTLPETGGIGTTIFYIVGAILVIGAGVLLIAKKRMNSQK